MRFRIRRGLRLGAAVLAVTGVVAVAVPSVAAARVKGPRIDSHTAHCGALQDRADAIRAEIWQTKSITSEQIAELQSIGRSWSEWCAEKFGSITREAYVQWSVDGIRWSSSIVLHDDIIAQPAGITVGQVKSAVENATAERLAEPLKAIAVAHSTEDLTATQIEELMAGRNAGEARLLATFDQPRSDFALPVPVSGTRAGGVAFFLIPFGDQLIRMGVSSS